MPDTIAILLDGLREHRDGALDRARGHYRAALEAEPEHPLGLYYLGLAELAGRKTAAAVALLRRAQAARPGDADTDVALADALAADGQVAAALELYRAVLSRDGAHVAASVNLANALLRQGDPVPAIPLLEAVLRHDPARFAAQATLGAALLAADRPSEAVAAYRAAVALRPDDAAMRAALATAWLRAGEASLALAESEAALARAHDCPDSCADAWLAHGAALSALGLPDRAAAAFARVLAQRPDDARAHLNLGNALLDLDRAEAAERHLRFAIARDPASAEAHASLGYLLAGNGRLHEAIGACQAAIDLKPDFAQAHWNQGTAYLLAGDLRRGWEKYEWRRQHPRFAADFRNLPGPRWRGEELAGLTLLVLAEQGLGDTIQCARYAQLLAGRGARVVFACAPTLVPLLRTAPGVAEAVGRRETLPAYDVWVDQMSVPRLLGTDLASIPSPEGYLVADPARAADWRAALPAGPRVGIVWAGNPAHSNDRRRSMRLADIAPVLAVPGVSMVSLQVGPSAGAADGAGFAAVLGGRLRDFADTAAAIDGLDLVVAVDTSTAHLAGAMGREVWTMLPAAPDWRWMTGRSDTPWYASMRLFRQPVPGDWASVTAAVAAALAARFEARDVRRQAPPLPSATCGPASRSRRSASR